MKKDFQGEAPGSVRGVVNNPKTVGNHTKVQNTGTSGKEVGLQNLKNSTLPPPKK